MDGTPPALNAYGLNRQTVIFSRKAAKKAKIDNVGVWVVSRGGCEERETREDPNRWNSARPTA